MEIAIKVYISGSYTEQKRLREESHKLFALGHCITSTWLNEVQQPSYLTKEQWYASLAVKDLAEVSAADCFILDLVGVSTTGGRFVEFGYALGRHSMLILLVGGSDLGVFDTLANESMKDWGEVVEYFTEDADGHK